MTVQWFSQEYDTIEEAQASVGVTFFSAYAVLKTPAGKFVLSYPRFRQWSKAEINEIAENVERLTGNRMVAYTDALFGWTEYKD